MSVIEATIVEALRKLDEAQQQQVLDYIHGLVGSSTLPPGIPGEVLWQRAVEINFDPEALAEMMQAIEEDCERIDWDGWDR